MNKKDIAVLRVRAERGDGSAQFELCVVYANGQGVIADLAAAERRTMPVLNCKCVSANLFK